uniref:DUF834 domain-containing protein n=1 Tax=Oryza barthii TaxID=65489 RepID=A0A0D3FTG6_9ORYZ
MGATRVVEAARDGHGEVSDGGDGWLWRRRGCPAMPVEAEAEETRGDERARGDAAGDRIGGGGRCRLRRRARRRKGEAHGGEGAREHEEIAALMVADAETARGEEMRRALNAQNRDD